LADTKKALRFMRKLRLMWSKLVNICCWPRSWKRSH